MGKNVFVGKVMVDLATNDVSQKLGDEGQIRNGSVILQRVWVKICLYEKEVDSSSVQKEDGNIPVCREVFMMSVTGGIR